MPCQLSKKITVAFSFLLLLTNVYSQKNYKDGYVVLKSGDTLRGQIDYRNWEINPSSIQFHAATEEKTFSPADLNYFEITGTDSYFSQVVTKDMRPIDIATLSSGAYDKDTTVTDTAFLRLLVNGTRLNLYVLADAAKKHYYYQQGKSGKTIELFYKKYLNDGNNVLEEQTIYRNQLFGLNQEINGAESITRKIGNANYNEKDLSSIVRLLNGEELATVKKLEAKKRMAFQVLAGAGAQHYSFKFAGDVNKWASFKFKDGLSPVALISLDMFSSRDRQKFALRFEASYSHPKYEGTYQKRDLLNHLRQYDYKLDQTNIMPAIDFLYHFVNKDNFRLYIGAGIGFVFSSYSVNEYHTKDLDTGVEDISYNEIAPEKVWISPNILAGARFGDKFNLCLATKFGGGFINYSSIKGKYTPISLTASYVIFSRMN